MKYKIFLDSNRLFNQYPIEEPFNLSVDELVNFIKKHKIKDTTICLPEIVIRERLQQKLEDIDKEIGNFNKIRKTLNNLGHEVEAVIPLATYRETLEQKIADYVSKNKITRVELPSISKEDLIDRAINKMKPFDDNASGFKDTLIYLSIVEDALDKSNSADRYIYCTKDVKQFDDSVVKEFKSVTKKDLYICLDVTKVTEKLDELLPLNLHLETRNQQLKNIVLKNIGDVMVEVNKKDTQRVSGDWGHGFALYNSTRPHSNIRRFGSVFDETNKEELIVGYNFDEINFSQFSELSGDRYLVTARLSTIIKYKEDSHDKTAESSNIYSAYLVSTRVGWGIDGYRVNNQNFDLTFECNLKKETIQSISSNKALVF